MLVKPTVPHDTAEMDDLTDFVTLLGELQGGQPEVRRQAAFALRETPSAILLLCDRLEVEADPSVRSVLLTSLIRMQSGLVADRLANLLRSENVALRNAVIEALQSMPSEALPKLGTLIEDSDSDIRLFAVNVLSAVPHPTSRHLLTRVLLEESHVNVCLAAVDGLSDVADEEMIPTLQAYAARFPAVPLVQFAVSALVKRVRGRE